MRAQAFYLLATLSCIFGILAITRRNPVHSALMLVASLLSIAGVYLALGALFVAMAQVFVYAGAIVVLFIFVIMLVGTKPETLGGRTREGWAWGLGASLLVGAVLATRIKPLPGFLQEIIQSSPALQYVLSSKSAPASGALLRIVDSTPQDLAAVLVGAGGVIGEHALAFEMGSFLVLVAMVGAVMLSKRRS